MMTSQLSTPLHLGAIYLSGPCGGSGGTPFNMNITTEQNPRLTRIHVHYGTIIDAIGVDYIINNRELIQTPCWGGTGGTVAEIKFSENEILIGVNGTYGEFNRLAHVVRSLTLITNLRAYGPYGRQEGVPFFLHAGLGKIVGFHGRSGTYLDSIGVYVHPVNVGVCVIRPDESQVLSSQAFRLYDYESQTSSLAFGDGGFDMIADDAHDEAQFWIKDTRYSKYTEKDDQPAFALIHKKTGQYLVRQQEKLLLVAKQPLELDDTCLWTEGPAELMPGFRAIRAYNDTSLVLQYQHAAAAASTTTTATVGGLPIGLTRIAYDKAKKMEHLSGTCWKFIPRN